MPQTLLELRTARVKCARFHPRRQWVLVAQHDGFVEIWDWNISCRVDRFLAHNAPVRAAAFHSTQAIFATAGDDKVIKLWDLESRKMIAVLAGHTDYIRSLDFSNNLQPWLCSASDDGTIRIWNWQSRKCVAIAVGHQGFVMCAKFHPSDLLLASGSMDGSVRVWDLAPIIQSAGQKQSLLQSLTQQYLNMPGCILSYSVNGQSHSRGVNWVSWGKENTIFSSADDNSIKQWRLNKSRSSGLQSISDDALLLCIHTFNQHNNNVNCVEVGLDNILVSASSDGTIGVHELQSKKFVGKLCVGDLRKYIPSGWEVFSKNMQSDVEKPLRRSPGSLPRFWCASQHPNESLWAVGHDEGFAVLRFVDYSPLAAFNKYFIRKHKLIEVSTSKNEEIVENEIFELQKIAAPRGAFGAGLVVAAPDELFVLGKPLPIIIGFSEFNLFHVYGASNTPEALSGTAATADGTSFALFSTEERKAVIFKANAAGLGRCAAVDLGGRPTAMLLKSAHLWAAFPDGRLERHGIHGGEIEAAQLGFPAAKLLLSPDSALIAAVGASHVALLSAHLQGNPLLAKVRTATPTTSLVFASIFPKSDGSEPSGRPETLIYATRTHVCYLTKNKASGALTSVNRPVTLLKAEGQTLVFVDDRGVAISTDFDAKSCGLLTAVAEARDGDVRRQLPRAKRQALGISVVSELLRAGAPKIALQMLGEQNGPLKTSLAVKLGILDGINVENVKNTTQLNDLYQEALLQGRGITAFNSGNVEQAAFTAAIYDDQTQIPEEKYQKAEINEQIGAAILQFNDLQLCKTLVNQGAFGAAYVLIQRAGIDVNVIPRLSEAIKQSQKQNSEIFQLKYISKGKKLTFKSRNGKLKEWKIINEKEFFDYEEIEVESGKEEKEGIKVSGAWVVDEESKSSESEASPVKHPVEVKGNAWTAGNDTESSDTESSDSRIMSRKEFELVTPGSQLLKSAGFSLNSEVFIEFLAEIKDKYEENMVLPFDAVAVATAAKKATEAVRQGDFSTGNTAYRRLLMEEKLLECADQLAGKLSNDRTLQLTHQKLIHQASEYIKLCHCFLAQNQIQNEQQKAQYAVAIAASKVHPDIRLLTFKVAIHWLRKCNTKQAKIFVNEIEKLCKNQNIEIDNDLEAKMKKVQEMKKTYALDQDIDKINSLDDICFDYGAGKLVDKAPTYACTICNSQSSKQGLCVVCQLGDWL